MKKTVIYNEKEYKVFTIKAFHKEHKVIVVERRYGNESLALEVLECKNTGSGCLEVVGSFGILTVNLGAMSKLCQFVKNYSENEEWAEALAKEIGGKDTGIKEKTGFVEVPFYDFSQIKIYAENEKKNLHA